MLASNISLKLLYLSCIRMKINQKYIMLYAIFGKFIRGITFKMMDKGNKNHKNGNNNSRSFIAVEDLLDSDVFFKCA